MIWGFSVVFSYIINEENTFSGKVSYVTLAIKSFSNEKFSVEKIGWLMRLALWLKLIKSPLFIQKDIALFSDEDTTNKVFENSYIQHLLISIFNEPLLYDTKKIIFSNENNELSIKFKLNKTYKLKEIKIEKFIEKYANKFVNIYENINFEKLENKSVIENDDKLNPIKFGLLFIGIWGLSLSFIENLREYPLILEHTPLFWLSFKVSLILGVLIGLFVLQKISHSIFKFSIGVKFFLSAIFSFFVVSLLSIKYINIIFDKSDPYTLVKILKLKEKRPKTGHLFFHFEDGNKIGIDKDLYDLKNKGEMIYLSTQKGYLGLEWVSDVK